MQTHSHPVDVFPGANNHPLKLSGHIRLLKILHFHIKVSTRLISVESTVDLERAVWRAMHCLGLGRKLKVKSKDSYAL